MTDFQNISNALNAEETRNITVSIVSLGGVDTQEIAAGTTVAAFKDCYGLAGKKLVNQDGDVLTNSDILSADTQIFVSSPKQNG